MKPYKIGNATLAVAEYLNTDVNEVKECRSDKDDYPIYVFHMNNMDNDIYCATKNSSSDAIYYWEDWGDGIEDCEFNWVEQKSDWVNRNGWRIWKHVEKEEV